MRVSCLQEDLVRGLAVVRRAVATRSTSPVLNNVYLGTDGGCLKLAATNLEIGLSCRIEAQIEEEGAITVPARLFDELVRQSPPERIELTLDPHTETLHYRCAAVSADIKGLPATEFPVMPTADTTEGLVVSPDGKLLAGMVKQVVFAAAREEIRPVLTGVLVELEEDRITMAAADGFRLSVRQARPASPVETPVQVIIPARAMSELGRLAGQVEGEVQVILSPNHNQVLFHMDNIDLVSQLIEGNFPDYRRIIPENCGTRVVVDTDQFLSAVRRALIFARDVANAVSLQVGGDGMSRLVVRAEATTGGGEETLAAAVEGEGLEIVFNGRFLVDVLSAVGSPQVALEVTTPSGPGVFRPVGSDADFTHVVMSMCRSPKV